MVRSPLASTLTQVPAPPPNAETRKLLVDAVPKTASAEVVAPLVMERLTAEAKPVLSTLKSVEVALVCEVQPIAKRILLRKACEVEDAAKMENCANGEVVPTPTLPLLAMMKLVAVEEPTTNWGPVPMAFEFTLNWPQGVDEPIPRNPVAVNVEVAVPPK